MGIPLSDAELGALLTKGKDLVKWYGDIEKEALVALLDGKEIFGWKAVEGRSNRKFADLDAALKAIQAAGYDEALLYDRKAKTLTALEKLMGKKEFDEKLAGHVVKPPGKPTLTPESDKREPYNSAVADFKGVGE